MNPTARRILFSMFCLMVAVVLWKMAFTTGPEGKTEELDYTSFVTEVEKNNVSYVTVTLSQASAELYGEFKEPARNFRLTVAKEQLSELTKLLRDKDVAVSIREAERSDWLTFLLNAVPFLLLVAFWIFMLRQMQSGGAKGWLAGWPHKNIRMGIGYDLHRFEYGRPLIIGGVEIEFDKGPVGHSDGDVLSHAICDALLGAAGLGDIGTHFPDTDPKWEGASSLKFLEHTRKLLGSANLRIVHIDAIVVTEKPKLGPHFAAMRKALAHALGIEEKQINLKAKTNEGVDAVGHGEAIAAHAIATLEG